ncbi:MAG: hypothetical protein JAY90_21650 [Candidatus Thiodiazotropha lotti]|nr:hypothetical protein [Candidatus Thiodiazotropha lotti]
MCARYRLVTPLVFVATITILTGCAAIPHNDVLVFATQTTLGVDVSASATGQSPKLSIGYKRDEGVWMPLLVNGRHTNKHNITFNCQKNDKGIEECDPSIAGELKYVGKSKGIDAEKGGKNEESDTYSVFASFGGQTSGGTGSAKLGVAQFFATGIAAQRLGANPDAYRLISPEDSNQQALDEAKKRADSEKARADAADITLKKQEERLASLSAEQIEALYKTGDQQRLVETSQLEILSAHLKFNEDPVKATQSLATLVDSAKTLTNNPLDDAVGEDIKTAATDDDFRRLVTIDNQGSVDPLFRAYSKTVPD